MLVKRWSLLLSAFLLPALLSACATIPHNSPPSATPAPRAPPCPLPDGDPLCALNQVFRDAYTQRRSALLQASEPRIAQIGNTLVLLHRGQRYEGPAVTAHYHELKSISHIPLALYSMLHGVGGPLDTDTVKRLEEYRTLIIQTTQNIDGRFSAEQLPRQRAIISDALAFIDKLVAQKSLTAAELTAYTRSQEPNILYNVEQAARDQIETMHATVESWKKMMTPEEFARLRVIVATVHMARPGNVAMQYFSVMLGEPYGGRFDDEDVRVGARLYAAEGLFNEQQVFSLMGTHLLDGQAGGDFFNDPLRMDRDLLADSAERIIREKFGKTPDVPACR